MPWFVKLTARSNSGQIGEEFVRVDGDRVEDLLYNDSYKWKNLSKMLDRGTLIRVDIDFKPRRERNL
jgi:hypothetical protein